MSFFEWLALRHKGWGWKNRVNHKKEGYFSHKFTKTTEKMGTYSPMRIPSHGRRHWMVTDGKKSQDTS